MLLQRPLLTISSFFFFNDTATTEIYTLSLHDALPILLGHQRGWEILLEGVGESLIRFQQNLDRKSTRLNSSHLVISYAVFCLKKKNQPSSRQYDRASAHGLPAAPQRRPRTYRGVVPQT